MKELNISKRGDRIWVNRGQDAKVWIERNHGFGGGHYEVDWEANWSSAESPFSFSPKTQAAAGGAVHPRDFAEIEVLHALGFTAETTGIEVFEKFPTFKSIADKVSKGGKQND